MSKNRKPLLIVSQEPSIAELKVELDAQMEACRERMKFVEKSRNDVVEDVKKAKKAFWEKTEAILLEKRIIEKEMGLEICDGVIYEMPEEDDDVHPLLKLLGIDPNRFS